jgi:hypothetical protein
MNLKQVAYWIPRLLAVVLILFTSLFALDVFDEGMGGLPTLLALFMHLLPQILIAIALLIAWRRPMVGGILFILLSGFALFLFGKPLLSPAHFMMTYPLVLIAILFFVQARSGSGDWRQI